jgi:DNA replication protein DnaC
MRGEATLDAPLERIRRHLVDLRMPRALETLDQLIQQLERGQVGAIEAIESLLAEEITIREGRRVKAALQMARLTPIKTLSTFDFTFQPSLDRSRIMALAALDFIDRHEVIHFIGQSGTGKSHLAIALGVEAVRSGRSVYFSPLADIIDSLARAEREGRLRERIRYLCRASLLIIDEIGYLSIGAGAGVSGTRAYPALVSFPNRRHTYGSPFGHGGQSSLRIDKKRHSIWFCRGFPLTEACRAGATGCISVVALRRKTLCSR